MVDRDDGDLIIERVVRAAMSAGCPFCHITIEEPSIERPLAVARRDLFPVSKGHTRR
jgi:hypothetical protein